MSKVKTVVVLAIFYMCHGLPMGFCQDNPIVRKLLTQKISEELKKHQTEETAFKSEHKEDKNRLGIKWTNEAKSWLWFKDPDQHLNVEITKFEMAENGSFAFGIRAKAKAQGKVVVRARPAIQADTKFSADVEIEMAGSVKLNQDFQPVEAKISDLSGKISGLKFNNNALNVVKKLIQDAINGYIRDNKAEFAKDIEKAIAG